MPGLGKSIFMNPLTLIAAAILSTTGIAAQAPVVLNCQFNHMAFPVKDLAASSTFYMKVFQLQEITNRTKNPDIRWFSMGGDKELHLIANVKEPVTINKAVHLAFSTDQMDAFVKNLAAMGIAYSNWAGTANTISPRADGVMQLYLQDPDGYWIEVNNGYAAKPNVQEIKDAVWKLEEDYWVYVKNKDFQRYLTLWDDHFIGYPSTNKIGGKANITDWITEMFNDNTRRFDYSLTRQVENVFGDIVIVLYDATQIWTNAQGQLLEKTTFKLTHTWKQTDKGWQIIGGMGAKK
jgi:catechol 2,3-dioxygenase-like lactoylglutathione lyase family enzyme/ketosteroid isomerase-like protein